MHINKDNTIPYTQQKINEALDDLRELCGIYIKYDGNEAMNSNVYIHRQYSLFTDETNNINSEGCEVSEFSKNVKKYIISI